MNDIVTRLRRWAIATDAVPASDLMDEAAAEIELLRGYRDEAEAEASIASLAAQRLRQTRADMIGTDDEQHYWDCHDAAAEIERLRSRPCPYVTGNVTRYCTLTPLTLTDEEREAVEAILVDADSAWSADNAAALRGLLERTQFAKRESDRPQPIATPNPLSTPAEGTVQTECTETGET